MEQPQHPQHALDSLGKNFDRLGSAVSENFGRLARAVSAQGNALARATEKQRDNALRAADAFHLSLSAPKPQRTKARRVPAKRVRRPDRLLVPSAAAAELPGEKSHATSAPAAPTSAPEPKGSSLHPTLQQFLTHPVALFHYVPKDAALFCAGAVAGATAKTITAPLDRWKLLLQVKSVQSPQGGVVSSKVNLVESFIQIGKEEGLLGYWKGNLPQVIRIIPYSAVQLFAYETYKKLFKGDRAELSVPARLAAGACAGMTSTFITYPLDVLRLRLAVEPGSKQMTAVALKILREEGAGAFYKGLGPSLISIAPYIALNFCAFDLVKNSIPEKYRKTPQASLFTALCATSFATVMCYPLDTIRRQMQMKNSPFRNLAEAVPGIIKRDGIQGLYRGFIANALKNLPNSSIRLTTYDTAKQLIAASNSEFSKLVQERQRAEAAESGAAETNAEAAAAATTA